MSGKSKFYIPTFSVVKREGSFEQQIQLENEEVPNHNESTSTELTVLAGEVEVKKLDNVKRYLTPSTGMIGNLYCTTFRLAFVAPLPSPDSSELVKHRFITLNDIPLTGIYQISLDKAKKATNVKTSQLKIVTKDFNIHYFDLSSVKKDLRKSFMKAILHHTSPLDHSLLFGFCFCPKPNSEIDSLETKARKSDVESWLPAGFYNKYDWEQELVRCKAKKNWRVTTINENYRITKTLPEYFPVPQRVTDYELKEAAGQFDGNRFPIWCYTHSTSCSVVAISSPNFGAPLQSYENRLIEAIVQADSSEHVYINDPHEVNVTKEIASVQEIQHAFNKLISLCATATSKEFNESDNTIYGLMDSSRWLRYVSNCLKIASNVADTLKKGLGHALVREDAAWDLSCVVTCLVQLMLDADSRTIKGFQNLIERYWVSYGHPFRERMALVKTLPENTTPVFLLFLDCVYQLTLQFPTSFEFSEFYLIVLWDSCLSGLFIEFICNCNLERQSRNDPDKKTSHRGVSVWNWDFQYDSDFISLFKNPLYEFVTEHRLVKSTDCTLQPRYHLSQIEIWHGCYYRYIPQMQIQNGGRPAEYLQQCLLMQEVTELQNQIARLKSDSLSRSSGLFFNASHQQQNIVSSLKSSYIISSFPFNNKMYRNLSDISLNAMLQKSIILSESATADNGDDYDP